MSKGAQGTRSIYPHIKFLKTLVPIMKKKKIAFHWWIICQIKFLRYFKRKKIYFWLTCHTCSGQNTRPKFRVYIFKVSGDVNFTQICHHFLFVLKQYCIHYSIRSVSETIISKKRTVITRIKFKNVHGGGEHRLGEVLGVNLRAPYSD